MVSRPVPGRCGWGAPAEALSAPDLEGVVAGALVRVIGVKKLFEPLDELEIVLEATLHQLVDGDDLRTSKADGKEQGVGKKRGKRARPDLVRNDERLASKREKQKKESKTQSQVVPAYRFRINQPVPKKNRTKVGGGESRIGPKTNTFQSLFEGYKSTTQARQKNKQTNKTASLATGSVRGWFPVAGGRCRPSVGSRRRGSQVGLGSGARAWTKAEDAALASFEGVVRRAVVVGVEELFEPLEELEVVLEPALYQLVHGDDLHIVSIRRGHFSLCFFFFKQLSELLLLLQLFSNHPNRG